MSLYRLRGVNGTADTTASAVAMIQIRADGVLYGYAMKIVGSGYVLNAAGESDGVHGQVSFNSVANFENADSNDVIGSVASHASYVVGISAPATSDFVVRADGSDGLTGLRIPVFTGDRIYLRVVNSANAVTDHCEAILYVEDGLDARRRGR